MKKIFGLVLILMPLFIYSVESHNMTISTLIFSEDGKKLYSASFDSTGILWDVNSGKGLYRTGGQRGFMTSMAISRPFNIMLTAARDMTIAIRNLEGKIIRVIKGHSDSVNFVIIRDKMAYSASDNGEIIFWSLPAMQRIKYFRFKTNGIDAMSLSPDGNTLIAGSVDGKIRVIDVKNMRLVKEFAAHNGYVFSLYFINNNRFISGSSTGELSLWNVTNLTLVKKNPTAGIGILSLVVHQNKIYAGTKAGKLVVFDINNLNAIKKFSISDKGLNALTVSPVTGMMAAGDDAGVIRIIQPETGAILKTMGNP